VGCIGPIQPGTCGVRVHVHDVVELTSDFVDSEDVVLCPEVTGFRKPDVSNRGFLTVVVPTEGFRPRLTVKMVPYDLLTSTVILAWEFFFALDSVAFTGPDLTVVGVQVDTVACCSGVEDSDCVFDFGVPVTDVVSKNVRSFFNRVYGVSSVTNALP